MSRTAPFPGGSAYLKSEDVMNTPLLKAFDYRSEPEELKKQYGGRLGTHCLLARRLVQAGCSFVEIEMGGWDTHADNFNAVKRNLGELDPAMGTLVKDLAERDLLPALSPMADGLRHPCDLAPG